MKIVNHKDGSRSFRFGPQEQVSGSKERIKALNQMAIVTGGEFSMMADMLMGCGEIIAKHPTGVGSEALIKMWKTCLRSAETPFGSGCMEIAKRKL